MSYDFCVFYTIEPLTHDDAGELYQALVGAEVPSTVEPSPPIAAFLAELTGRYPDIDDVAESEVANNPWAGGFEVGQGHVAMTIRPARAPEVGRLVVELAARHGLVCFDPQEGEIVAAPPGIRVAEHDLPARERGNAERERPEWPFVEALDAVLKLAGYARRGRLWRKIGDTAIIAMRLRDEDWGYDVWIAVWLRSRGEVDPREVKPGERGKWHFHVRLSPEILDPPQSFKLDRALAKGDLGQAEISATFSEATRRGIRRAMEPGVPLTMEWRQAAIRSVFETSVLPILARIESGEITDPDQLDRRLPLLEEWALECQHLRDEGAGDDTLIDLLFRELAVDDRGPTTVYRILELAYGLKSWEGGKLADRIDEKWEQLGSARDSE